LILLMEPVVGIGRFNLMNWRKISDLLRKSTSLGKSPGPSTTRFTGQFTGQLSARNEPRITSLG